MGYGRITEKQQEILDCIKQEILNKGYPPTVRELCDAVNLKSTSSIVINFISFFGDAFDIYFYLLKINK
jgi:hypothetical protein